MQVCLPEIVGGSDELGIQPGFALNAYSASRALAFRSGVAAAALFYGVSLLNLKESPALPASQALLCLCLQTPTPALPKAPLRLTGRLPFRASHALLLRTCWVLYNT